MCAFHSEFLTERKKNILKCFIFIRSTRVQLSPSIVWHINMFVCYFFFSFFFFHFDLRPFRICMFPLSLNGFLLLLLCIFMSLAVVGFSPVFFFLLFYINTLGKVRDIIKLKELWKENFFFVRRLFCRFVITENVPFPCGRS